jgi:outer membrane protein
MGRVVRKTKFGCRPNSRLPGAGIACAIFGVLATTAAGAATLEDALVKTYQNNPALNSERARQRGTDENIPQALSGYRPQLVGSLSAGLQAVRNILPDNTIQGTTLKPWTIGLTVTQVLFNGYKTASNVRIAEFQVKSGREALRNVEQGVMLDAVRSAPMCRCCGKSRRRPGAGSMPAT